MISLHTGACNAACKPIRGMAQTSDGYPWLGTRVVAKMRAEADIRWIPETAAPAESTKAEEPL